MFSLEKIKFIENSFPLEMINLCMVSSRSTFDVVRGVMEKDEVLHNQDSVSEEIAVMYIHLGESSFYI